MKAFTSLLLLVFASSCSGHYLKKTSATDQRVDKVDLNSVRFFAPDYEVASMDDFENHDRVLSCVSPQDLWASLFKKEATSDILSCVNSLKEVVHYIYVPKAKPYLELDPFIKTHPECLKKFIPRISLPREVYFLGTGQSEPALNVYAMSFDTKANQVVDAELRVPRFEILLHFPISRKLNTVQDLNLWLLVTTLSMFKDKDELWASSVPELTWKQCFKTDPYFKDKRSGHIPPLFWP